MPQLNDVPLIDDQFGIRLRKLRRGRMWSLAQAVDAFNEQLKAMKSPFRITTRMLGSWERGTRQPPLGPKVEAVAHVYGVTGDWLLVGEE